MDFLAQGLTSSEADKRLEYFGQNVLPEERPSSDLNLIVSQLKSSLIYILIFAAAVSFWLGQISDALVILLAVFINTILGFYQERKAERALLALKKILTPHAKVLRDGSIKSVEAKIVVPQDIVVLSGGDKVPADGVLVEDFHLLVNEAVLTGESAAVNKIHIQNPRSTLQNLMNRSEYASSLHLNISSRDNIKRVTKQFDEARLEKRLDQLWERIEESHKLFMGTTILSGRGKMLVVKTGKDSRFGVIATKLMTIGREETPLQRRLNNFSKFLAILVGAICLFIFAWGVFFGRPLVEMFKTSVALAVAAIPEGLAVALTVILAIGMQRILKRKALVRRLIAAETLGSTTVIATDKTGTLTEGLMTVVESDLVDKNLAFQNVIFCNNLIDPLEIALWQFAKEQSGFDAEKIVEENKRVDEMPFDSERKYMWTVIKSATSLKSFNDKQQENSKVKNGNFSLYVKGAPEIILEYCNLTDSKKAYWQKEIENWARKGLRIIGLAYKNLSVDEKVKEDEQVTFKNQYQNPSQAFEEKQLLWLGLVGIEDPVRKSVASALSLCKQAGIRMLMVTGDYARTAEAIFKKVMGAKREVKIVDGKELDGLTDRELGKVLDAVDIFSRVTPNQKLRIVEMLREKGEVVALVGDGVNDAPAIKRADIGIVVNEATDVAKETSDMILLDSNFSTIVAAIEEGRGIFNNIRKVILYLLSDTFSEILLIFLSILFRLDLPLTAAQILWINLITDGFPNLALTVDPKEKDLLKKTPIPRNAPMVDFEMKLLIFLISVVTALSSFFIFVIYSRLSHNLVLSQTLIFATLGIDSLLYVFSTRSLTVPLWRGNLFNNPYLIIAVVGGFVLQIVAIYFGPLQQLLNTVALGPIHWFIVFTASVFVIILIEGVKEVFLHKKDLDRLFKLKF